MTWQLPVLYCPKSKHDSSFLLLCFEDPFFFPLAVFPFREITWLEQDDLILPSRNWVPVGKSNCALDVLKPQKSPIFKVAMAILKNTNFFRAFTTSSMIPAIYIQQLWDTMRSVGKDGRELFGMLIPNALLTDAIKRAPYYGEYLENVAKYQQYLDEEHGKVAKQTKPSTPKATKVTKPAGDEAPKHSSSQPPTSTPAPTESSKKDQGKKHKLVKDTSNAPSPAKRSKAGVPHKEPAYDDEEEKLQRALELSLKDQGEQVQGKGKEKVIEEQAAHDLLCRILVILRSTKNNK
ncbi:retrovirus-related pol polyprotein from transposon TNT 1-94 [Tanacetum coccineum]